MSDIKGIQIHNQRESEKTLENNPDIDRERIGQNYDLHTGDRDINYNHVVKDRLKAGYASETAIRKDAVTMVGVLVSSDREFFSKLTLEQQKQFFQTAYDYVAERYGRENIVSARVHMDETTPHMHLHLVPLTKDGRLSAKELFDRKNLLKLQQEMPARLQQAGFQIEKGEGRNPHKDTLTWKSEQAAKAVVQLGEQEKALQEQAQGLSRRESQIKDGYGQWHDIDALYERKMAETKGFISLLDSDTVKLSKAEFRDLCMKAQAGIGQKTKLQELSTELSYWKGHGKGKEPVLKLGEKVQKMLNENPQFKRQFAAAEQRHEQSLAAKLAQQMKAPIRRPGLKADLDPDDDKPKRGIKL